MRTLFSITIIWCLLTTGFVSAEETTTFPLTLRHLRFFNASDQSNNSGKVGAWLRGNPDYPFYNFSDETILKTDLSSLNGKIITNVTLRFEVDYMFTQTSSQTVSLYEQDKGAFSTSAVYDTYAREVWSNSLGDVTSASTGWKEINTQELKNLVQAWTNGSKSNEGFVLAGNFTTWEYYWAIDEAELVVTHQPSDKNITVNINGNGVVTYSYNGLPPAGCSNGQVITIPEGTIVTFYSSPDPNHILNYWDIDGSTQTTEQISITADDNKTVTAYFIEHIVTYTISTSTVGNGDITLDPPGGSYQNGTTVTVTANPNVGSYFTNWTGDASGSANPITVVMESDKNITANFELNKIASR